MLMVLQFFQHESQVYLLAGYENGSLVVWNMKQATVPCFVQHSTLQVSNDSAILGLAVHSLGTRWIVGSVGTQIKVYDSIWNQTKLESLKSVAEYAVAGPGIADVAIRKCDERVFATAGWDHRVRIYDLKRNKPLTVLKYHSEAVHAVDFNFAAEAKAQISSDLSQVGLLASASKDGKVALWNIAFEKK